MVQSIADELFLGSDVKRKM